MKKLFMIAMAAVFSMAMAAPGFAQGTAPATEKKAEKAEKKADKADMKADEKKAEAKEKKADAKKAANPCAAKAEKK